MSRTSGLVFCVAAAAVCAAHALVTPFGRADDPKKEPPGEPERGRPQFSHFIKLPSSDDLENKLEAAPDYLRGGDWARGTRLLQAVLDHPEDAFVPVRRAGRDGVAWVSARTEANRLLATVPPRGLEVYEVQAGAKAAALLAAARRARDLAQLAQVAERYGHTTAGRQAADLLGTHALDRGHYETAARYFRRLLRGPGAARLEPLTLLKASFALHRAGDEAAADEAWKVLASRAPTGVRVGERHIPLAVLRKELDRVSAAAAADPAAREWRTFRGSPERAATVPVRLAGLRRGWDQPTLGSGPAADWVATALVRARDRGQVALPAAFPLAVGGKLVFRDRKGVRAVNPVSGELHWEASLSGTFDELTEEPANLAHVSSWASTILQNFPHVLVENATAVALSADARRVYAVEDLAVLPVARDHSSFVHNSGAGLTLTHAAQLTDAVYHSRLMAVDLETGRLLWEAGGRGGDKDQDLHDAHFLGPPLPLGDRLYALIEKRQALRLVCLDPTSGRLCWAQTLGVAKKNVLIDGARRTWAAHPAYAEGVLVCPTNSGAVIAVDLAGRGLLWAHSYREAPPLPQPQIPPGARVRFRRGMAVQPQVPLDLSVKWKLTAPLIARGKVLLAAPDGGHLDCLDLRTGELLWQSPRREEDLYIGGVYKDCALLVSRNRFAAVRLASGVLPWGLDIGEPAGLGILAGSMYYLPVRSCPELRGPAVYGIDLEKRAVVSRTPLPGGDEPGNLLVTAGQLVSQTATRIAAYPCAEGKSGGAD